MVQGVHIPDRLGNDDVGVVCWLLMAISLISIVSSKVVVSHVRAW